MTEIFAKFVAESPYLTFFGFCVFSVALAGGLAGLGQIGSTTTNNYSGTKKETNDE